MLTQIATDINEPDLCLLQRYVATGDADVFAEIVRRHSAAVYSACRRILNDDARAQEVSQETFFRLLRQPCFVTQSLGGWLHRSATHLAIDAQRSEVARRARERRYWSDFARDSHDREMKWEDISPHVDAAVNELPEPSRTLLIRHFLQSVPQADLATEMKLSAATVSRKIKSAVADLRKLLKQKGIYVGLVALTEFCRSDAVKACPPRLTAELTKMAMVGPIDLGPVPGARPVAAKPPLFRLRAGGQDSWFKLLGSGVGAFGLVACLTLISFSLSREPGYRPRRPIAPPAEQKIIDRAESPSKHSIR